MSWLRSGDTAADYPKVHAVAVLPDAPDGAHLLMHGFMWCLSTNSASWKSDYVVDLGTIVRYGGQHAKWLLAAAVKTGLLTKVKGKVHGVDAYKIIDDPAYLHIRTKAEQEWDAQQRAETLDIRIAGPVRYRDGDACRYCGVLTYWVGGQKDSDRRGTLDHLAPLNDDGTRPDATPDTMVVACIRCNASIGDTAPENRPQLRPEPVPAMRFYSKTTATFLRTKCGYLDVHATDPHRAHDEQATPPLRDPALGRKRPTSTTVDTARHAASDPAPAGPRAATPPPPDPDPPPPLPEVLRSGESGHSKCAGSGRDGSGQVGSGRAGTGSGSGGSHAPPLPPPASPYEPDPRRRRRSRRGRTTPDPATPPASPEVTP